jgi:hypothetical protein
MLVPYLSIILTYHAPEEDVSTRLRKNVSES